MTERPNLADWKRLGTAVQAARMRHDGWTDTAEWASAVGRSSRVLLGLERGEQTGDKTLRRVEEVLNWPPGHCDRILADSSVDTAPDVPKPFGTDFAPYVPERRPLDSYTTAELLTEIEDRYNDLALELHTMGRPIMTEQAEAGSRRLTPMSPESRRALLRTRSPEQVVDLARHRDRNGGTDSGDQE